MTTPQDREKEIRGYGTKANGDKVDIDSPEFRLNEYVSVTINERMSPEELKKYYPNIKMTDGPLVFHSPPLQESENWESRFDIGFGVITEMDGNQDWTYLYTKEELRAPSPKDLKSFIHSLLLAEREAIKREIIKKCQSEMYEALEEVAQYEKSLVNKHDIKVWIHNLPNSLLEEKK